MLRVGGFGYWVGKGEQGLGSGLNFMGLNRREVKGGNVGNMERGDNENG